MSAYRTVVVGTDGSDSSMRAVDRAATIAGADAKLIIASAYLPHHEDGRAADILKDESYKVSGTAPIYDDPARRQGAGAQSRCEERRGAADRRRSGRRAGAPRRGGEADLLVVGNVGLSTIAGRLLGSVPANVSRRAKVDVLIVHTTN